MAATEDLVSARARLIQNFRDSSARQGAWMARRNDLMRRQQEAANSPQAFMAQAGQMIATGTAPPLVNTPQGARIAPGVNVSDYQAAATQVAAGGIADQARAIQAQRAAQAPPSAPVVASQSLAASTPQAVAATPTALGAAVPAPAQLAATARQATPPAPSPSAQLASAVQAAHQPASQSLAAAPSASAASASGAGNAQPAGPTSGDVLAALRAKPPDGSDSFAAVAKAPPSPVATPAPTTAPAPVLSPAPAPGLTTPDPFAKRTQTGLPR